MAIKIFDTASHPTLSGSWFSQSKNASFEALAAQLNTQPRYLGACAIGLAGVNDYEHKNYINECGKDKRLVPIAGFNPLISSNIARELHDIASYGYKGIKIHPRLYGIDLSKCRDVVIETLNLAENCGLIVFLCTYYADDIKGYPAEDPFWQLVKIIKQTPFTKMVLMHGGMSRVLQYADLARFNDNILLDLSYLLIKYRNSSVEIDVRYLFETFDRKICIGSDHPQYQLSELIDAFDSIGSGLDKDKLNNIGHKNILSFLDINVSAF